MVVMQSFLWNQKILKIFCNEIKNSVIISKNKVNKKRHQKI